MGMAAEPEFHVLAVDDSLIDRKFIERLLKKSSYQVTTVDSGAKALEFLGLLEDEQPSVCPDSQQQKVEVNLIITDYCMPGMTGYDLLKKVKLSNIRCLEEGAEEFFLKPVRLSDVNRLRPLMLRAKYGQRKQDLLQKCHKLEQQQQEEEEQQQQQQQQQQQRQQELLQTEQHQCQQQQLQNSSNNNKRKSMDEELSTERTRPRYNGIATVV